MEEMMSVFKNPQAGFGLVEMMVGVLILAVGLLGLAELQITAMKGNSKSGSILAATLVAQDAIEEVMAVYDDDDTDPLYDIYTDALTVAVAGFTDWPINPIRSMPGSGRYRITYTSELDIGGVGSQITRVTIRVDSLDVIGFGPSSVSMETLKDLRKVIKL
jgi:prepilin-type N-terminal cleavage/methylation domain-containing protein